MSPLSTVFKVHRWIAGGFGLTLLLLPDAMSSAFRPAFVLPAGERLAYQSWGCFLLAVAYIVHAAPSFPLEAQRSVATGLLACFALITILYGYTVAAVTLDLDFVMGIAATGSVFAALLFAYAWALTMSPITKNIKK